jgi:NodT family efflux transporter outer membrane factor (OMF) lipoprotein
MKTWRQVRSKSLWKREMSSIKSIALCSLAALVVIAGCKVGPNYKPPATTMPVDYAELSPSTQPSTQPTTQAYLAGDLARWWLTFHDPMLDQLMHDAVESNLDLKIASARIREARASRGIVQSRLWPDINGNAQYNYNQASKSAVPGNVTLQQRQYNFWQAGFDAAWEIDVFGGIQRGVEAADADIQVTVEDRRGTLVSLMAEVGRNYVELRGAQRQLAITRQNVKSQRETLDLTEQRFYAGITSEVDVVRQRAQVESTASQIPQLEITIRQSIHALGVLLGRSPGALLDQLVPEAPLPQAPGSLPPGLPSELLRRRPDVRAAERALAAQTARIGEATADLFPKFSITGSFGQQSTEFKQLFNATSNFWSIGPAISLPIFNAGRIRSNIEVQTAREQQALAAFEQTVLRSMQDVEDALVAYDREQARRVSLSAAVEANRRAVDLSNQLYSRGLIDFLSVLDAERALFISEDALAISDTTVSTNLVALYKALGGGWEERKDTPTTQPKPDQLN